MKNESLIRYWGRKPPSLVENYIERFSRQDEIILDPFGGSGSIVKTAVSMKRRAIYSDINPFAKLLAEVSLSGCDLGKLEAALKKIDLSKVIFVTRRGLSKQIRTEKFFSIKCACNRPNVIKKIVYSRKYYTIKQRKYNNFNGIISEIYQFISSNKRGVYYERIIEQFPERPHQALSNAITKLIKTGAIREEIVPIKVFFNSPCKCGSTSITCPEKLKWVSDEKVLPAYWFPKYHLRYDNGIDFYKKRDVERIDEFFTERNLVFLSQLWNKIKDIEASDDVRKCLYLIFLITITRSSKMCRESGGTWPVNSYWIPRRFVVRNPYIVFKRVSAQVLNAISSKTPNVKKGNVKQVLRKQVEIAFLSESATDLSLPKNSIDYIITDPPHLDDVQFLELSFFYTSWLRCKLPFNSEMVVNPAQKKGIESYYDFLKKFSIQAYSILKPNKYMTLILHKEAPNILSKCIDIIESAGFNLCDIKENYNFIFYTFQKIMK